jgi:hypothetical protein
VYSLATSTRTAILQALHSTSAEHLPGDVALIQPAEDHGTGDILYSTVGLHQGNDNAQLFERLMILDVVFSHKNRVPSAKSVDGIDSPSPDIESMDKCGYLGPQDTTMAYRCYMPFSN